MNESDVQTLQLSEPLSLLLSLLTGVSQVLDSNGSTMAVTQTGLRQALATDLQRRPSKTPPAPLRLQVKGSALELACR